MAGAEGRGSGHSRVVYELPLIDYLCRELLRRGLGPAAFDVPPDPDPEGRRLGAVLILLYPNAPKLDGEQAPHLVLTRRTEMLRSHSGQISLPGGRYDPADGSLLRTALRETLEELGVEPAGLTILGRLEPESITVSHYLVAPFIAYAPRRPDFRPAPDEVAEDRRDERAAGAAGDQRAKGDGDEHAVHCRSLENDYVVTTLVVTSRDE